MKKLLGYALLLALAASLPLYAQTLGPPASTGSTFPPTGCVTANGVIFNNATPCVAAFTFDGTTVLSVPALTLSSGGALRWGVTSKLSSNSDGVLTFTNSAASNFFTITVGTVAQGSPAQFNGPIKTGGFTVAGLPTGIVGDRAYVTDQMTTCAVAGAALVGGGAVICPVFFNGTAWVGD